MFYQIANLIFMILAVITMIISTAQLAKYTRDAKALNKSMLIESDDSKADERWFNLSYDMNRKTLRRGIIALGISFLFLFAAFHFESAYMNSDYYLTKQAEKQMLINRKIEELSGVKQN